MYVGGGGGDGVGGFDSQCPGCVWWFMSSGSHKILPNTSQSSPSISLKIKIGKIDHESKIFIVQLLCARQWGIMGISQLLQIVWEESNKLQL